MCRLVHDVVETACIGRSVVASIVDVSGESSRNQCDSRSE